MNGKFLPAVISAAAVFMLIQTGCSHDEKPEETTAASTAGTVSETEAYEAELPERIWEEFEEFSWYENGIIEEDIYHPEGFLLDRFYAEYPILSGNDEMCRRITAAMEEFCRDKLESARAQDTAAGYDENGELIEEFADFYRQGAANRLAVNYHIDCDGSDLFGVCFTYFPDYAGAAPVYVYPTAMLFDRRTGDRIDFETLIADKEGFAAAMEHAYGRETDGYHENFVFGYTDGGDYVIGGNPVSERVTLRNGYVGFYFNSGESGAGRSDLGVYFAGLPAEDVLEYLTDGGRELFNTDS